MDRIVIVGGGISGLATAFRLGLAAEASGRAVHLTVLESGDVPGGKMRSSREEGFVIEWGPNGFLDSRPNAVALVNDLGAAPLLLRADETASKRFVCRGGRLVRLPETPPAFLKSRLLSRAGKLRLMREPWIPAGTLPDEAIGDLAARRLGPEARDYLVDPMISGVFAGDPSRLSAAAALPRLVKMERAHGSFIRGAIAMQGGPRKLAGKMLARLFGRGSGGSINAGPSGMLTSFKGGVATLVQAMAARVGPGLRLSMPVTSLRRTATGWLVSAGTGEARQHFPADALVLSCPSDEAARLLQDSSRRMASELAAIGCASITVVATAFARQDLPPGAVDGFGFLVPDIEHRPILGTLWDSTVFPDRAPDGQVLLRTMVGGARHADLAVTPDDALVPMVLAQLSDLMGISAVPTMVRVVRWPRGIPQYDVGHLDRMARIDGFRRQLPGLFLCHNAYRGISLDDCCREAAETAGAVMSSLTLS
jgi:oxygen-dependent protoporphyrinogen oxidase